MKSRTTRRPRPSGGRSTPASAKPSSRCTPTGCPEHFGVLAHHFTQAQRWDKALEYLLAAAQQAERTFATREALALYDDALRAAERLAGGVGDPKTLIRIHEAKARLYFVTSEFERRRPKASGSCRWRD